MQTPTPPFRVRGISDFNVSPIVVGQKYTITDISQDGTQWQTMAPNGKLGWFPAQMCKPVQTQTASRPAANPSPARQPTQNFNDTASPTRATARTAAPGGSGQQAPQRAVSTGQRTAPRTAPAASTNQRPSQSGGNVMETTLFGDVMLEEWEQ